MSDNVRKSLTDGKVGRHRRSDDFPVRQWLKLGLASAGMGAALLGFSLVGPDAATATADTGTESSAASESSDSAEAKDADSSSPATQRTRSTKASRATDANDDSGVATGSERADDAADESDDDDADNADAGKADPTPDLVEVEEDEVAVAEPDVDSLRVEVEFDSRAADLAEPAMQPASSTPPYQSELSPYQKAVAEILQSWTARHQTWVDSLDVSQQRKDRLTASFLAMRRTFFNQAPTVAPIQITGVITGPIVGTVGAIDPDGDRLVYIMTRAPKAGEVKLSADGTYTYVPDEDFDGVDTFHVAAIDIGLHMNLLQPLRPIASGLATSLINQGAVTFDFKYTAGSHYWTDESRDALQRAADLLIEHFRVVEPVVLSYDVTGFEDTNIGTIANAYGLLTNEQSGFWRTRIQHEMITGEDLNGQEADGYINVNFAKPLAFGDDVGLNQLDFTTTIMHELLHSFGFAFGTGVNGRWHYFARFIVTDGGNRLVNDDAALDLNYQLNVVGGNNGLFFGGANAVAANGGQLVRIYTPNPLEPGSSLTHLDLQTFENLLMSPKLNGGPGVRTLSNVELGIFRDLGYTVVPLVALPTAV